MSYSGLSAEASTFNVIHRLLSLEARISPDRESVHPTLKHGRAFEGDGEGTLFNALDHLVLRATSHPCTAQGSPRRSRTVNDFVPKTPRRGENGIVYRVNFLPIPK